MIDQVKNSSSGKYDHPCQMPYRVMANVIGVLPRTEKLLVVEPFAGTGTTLVACRDLGVDYIGFEIDPKYKEICEARIKDIEPKQMKSKYRQLKLI